MDYHSVAQDQSGYENDHKISLDLPVYSPSHSPAVVHPIFALMLPLTSSLYDLDLDVMLSQIIQKEEELPMVSLMYHKLINKSRC